MILSAAFLYAGLTCLCLSMDRHYRQVWAGNPTVPCSRALRFAGSVLVAGSCLLACLQGRSWSLGLVAWFGFLTAALFALAFMLPYAPRFTVLAAVVLPFAAGGLSFIGT